MTANCQDFDPALPEPEVNWLCMAAYASAARALPHVLQRGGFVAASLAEDLSAAFEKPLPPQPSAPLVEDTALAELLAQLPQRLRKHLHGEWRALEDADEGRRICLLEALAKCEEVPLGIIDHLGDCIMGHLADALAERYHLAVDMARYLAAEACSEAIARAIEQAPLKRIDDYMAELEAKGLISGERVLAYAQRGNSPLFYAALGHGAALEADMVEAFIADGGLRVLERILLRTDFAPVMQQTIMAAYAEAAGLG